MPFVYSTLSCDQRYTKYSEEKDPNILPREERSVLINGGANIADRNLVTLQGVVTQVSDEDLALLKQNSLFQTHQQNGFITIESSKVDVEKVVGDMETRDKSAPLTPEDFEVEDKKPPVVNTKKIRK